jgi:hypothetical protein
MKHVWLWAPLLLIGTGCYQQDPVVRAALDLQRATDEFVNREEDQTQRLNSLRLGMSDGEVLNAAGPPSARQSVGTSGDESREIWTYRGTMRPLGTLTFVNQRLVEIKTE